MQVGDPFTEKLLIEACLEIFAADLVTGIQDLGGAGLSCATSELASAGTGGMHVDLDTVPLRDSTLTAAEILMSESQERMCAIVEPAKVDEFLAVCRKWDVLATVIGEVTDGDRLTVDWHGERIVDVPPRTVAHEGPVYDRPMARPADLDALQADDAGELPRPSTGAELQAHWLAVVASPDGADKTWVTEQYDRYVRGNTVLAQPEDAGVVRIDEETHRGIALALDGNARYARLDPYAGAQLNLAEAYRNVAVVRREAARRHQLPELRLPGGARGHVAVRRGRPRPGRRLPRARPAGHRRQRQPLQPDRRRPDQPDAGHRRARGARGRPHAGSPAAGGRPARPCCCSARRARSSAARPGRRSCTATSAAGRRRSTSPAERALGELLAALGRDGLVSSAHDLADGGLAQTLAESALRYGVGAPAAPRRRTRSPRCSASRPRAPSSRRPTPPPCGRGRRGGRRPGHRTRDDGRRRAGRRRAARPAARPSSGPPGRRPCPALFGTPEAAVGAVPAGAVPTS